MVQWLNLEAFSICSSCCLLVQVICGFGRIGTMFGCDKYNIKPDLVSLAKVSHLQKNSVTGKEIQFLLDTYFFYRHFHPDTCLLVQCQSVQKYLKQLIHRATSLVKKKASNLLFLIVFMQFIMLDMLSLMDLLLGGFSHGFTYSGHPISCAVALEAIKIYK